MEWPSDTNDFCVSTPAGYWLFYEACGYRIAQVSGNFDKMWRYYYDATSGELIAVGFFDGDGNSHGCCGPSDFAAIGCEGAPTGWCSLPDAAVDGVDAYPLPDAGDAD